MKTVTDLSRPSRLAEELRGIAGKLRRKLREQADTGDLTPSQVAVLLRLEKEGPATASALARAEGMRPQSMGAVIAGLQAARFLTGSPDPDDGRQTILALTDACRKWIRDGRAARQDWLCRTIEARLSPEDQEILGTAIGLLRKLLDE